MLGDKNFENIKAAIKAVDGVPLYQFIEALGIGKVGTLAKEITNVAPTVDDIDKLTVDDLTKLDMFAEKKAQSFVDGWKDMRGEIKLLLRYVKIVQKSQSSDKLKDKKFCFTGSFDSPSRSEMEAMVPLHGGRLASVSKDLTALVFDGECTKGKYVKAQSLGVDIITQDEFLALLK